MSMGNYRVREFTVAVQYLDKGRPIHCSLRSWSTGGGPVAAAVSQSLVEVPCTDHTDITSPLRHCYDSQSKMRGGRIDGHAQ